MTANCTLRHCLRCGKLKRRPTPPQNLTFARWGLTDQDRSTNHKARGANGARFRFRWMRLSLRTSNFIPCLSKPTNWHRYCVDSATSLSRSEIAPEPAGHGLPLSKCEAYNRVYEQTYGSS